MEPDGTAPTVGALGPGWFLFLLLALAVVYSPVLLTSYACLDDYAQMYGMTKQRPGSELSWDLQHQWAIGRPLCGVMMDAFFHAAGSISGLRIVRAASVACLAVLAFVFARLLRRTGWSVFESLSLSFLLFTLPAFEVYAAWASTAPHPFACLIALSAVLLTERGWNSPGAARRLGWLLLAVIAQTAALSIYQPAAMFYVVGAAALLFSPRDAEFQWRKSLPFGVVLAVGLAMGYAVFQVGLSLYPAGVIGSRTGISFDVIPKVRWFLSNPLRDALNFHNLRVSSTAAAAASAAIALGLLVHLRGSPRARLVGLVAALAMVGGSYLPNLVAPENWSSYRTQAALGGVLLFFLFLGARTLTGPAAGGKVWSALVFVATMAAGVAAFHHTRTLFAVPQARELEAVRRFLARDDSVWTRNVDIKLARWEESLAPNVRYDEFGVPTTCVWWNVESMIRLIARDAHQDAARMRVLVLREGVEPRPDAVLIDMGAILRDAASR